MLLTAEENIIGTFQNIDQIAGDLLDGMPHGRSCNGRCMEGLLVAVVIDALYEAAAHGSGYRTPDAHFYKPNRSKYRSDYNYHLAIKETIVQFYEWLYAPETSAMSLAWICDVLTDARHDPSVVYRQIVARMEDLLAWCRLSDEDRIARRWEVSEKYNIFINEWLEL